MNRKKRRWPWIVGGILLVLIAVVVVPSFLSNGDAAYIAQGVAVKEGPIAYKILTRGDVESKFVYDIIPKVSGRVSQVSVQAGDVVNAGDVIAVLETEDLEGQLVDLELELKIANTQLNQIEVPSQEGQKATKEALEAQLENAQREYENAKVLYAEGAYTQSQVNAAELAVKNAKQSLANSGETSTAKKAQQERELQKLRIQGIELKIQRLKDSIANAQIKSPVGGTITKLAIKPYDFASTQSPIATVSDVEQLKITVNINQYDIQKIAMGQAVNVTADGLKDQVFSGTISEISSVAFKSALGQSQETVVPVTVDLSNKEGVFKPNYTAKVEIVVASKENAVIIPYEATRVDREKGRLAYVIQGDKIVEKAITVGIEGELFLEVLEGSLSVGDYLLVNPDETVYDGMPVVFTPPTEEVQP